ncbi:MAG TPA: tetratricopeptide repeat protein, partial [Polyangiaceae bacterium]|nr:tetratricopeptide repeat protein [Polyangiaceae bacterium]
MIRWKVVASLTATYAFATGSAYADSSTAMSESMFDEGKRLMSAGQYAQACPKFEESYRLDPATGTLLNLAACHEKEGKLASAWAEYRDAIAAARKDARTDRVTFATERANALEPLLSRLVIDVPANVRVASLQLNLDGKPLGEASWGTPIPLDPGVHRITAVAPTKKAWDTEIELGKKADRKQITVPPLSDLPPQNAAASAPEGRPSPEQNHVPQTSASTAADERREWQRPMGYVVGGLGIVGLGLGTVFLLQRGSKVSDRDAVCPSGLHCTEAEARQIEDLTQDARKASRLSAVGFAVGGIALVGGAVLVLTAPSGREASTSSTLALRAWRDARGTWLGA